MAVAVVIPAYNEAATIAGVVQRVLAQAPWVIVVDDGSTDATPEQLERLPVTVLRHAENRGKSASLRQGLDLAVAEGAEAVVTLDADGQHRPEDIPRLVAASARHPDRIIIAARVRRREHVPAARRFANVMADFWISWAAGYPIRDTQSGFRLYPAAVLRSLPKAANKSPRGFVFESEVLIDAARRGFFATSIAIDALYPRQNRASYYKPWLDTLRIVRMVAWKLLARGLFPQGLLRALGWLPGPGSNLETRDG